MLNVENKIKMIFDDCIKGEISFKHAKEHLLFVYRNNVISGESYDSLISRLEITRNNKLKVERDDFFARQTAFSGMAFISNLLNSLGFIGQGESVENISKFENNTFSLEYINERYYFKSKLKKVSFASTFCLRDKTDFTFDSLEAMEFADLITECVDSITEQCENTNA